MHAWLHARTHAEPQAYTPTNIQTNKQINKQSNTHSQHTNTKQNQYFDTVDLMSFWFIKKWIVYDWILIHKVRNVYTNHNKCDSVFHEQCGRTSLPIEYKVSWKYFKLILHCIRFLFRRIVQNVYTRISSQHRVCFDFGFPLSGSWRKWPLFGVSLWTLYCQITMTRQFVIE